jgi:hypothetical protein
MRHSFKIVHGPWFDSSERTPDERAGHRPIGCEPELQERIADVVIAEEEPGIVDRDDFGGVVGLGAGSREGDWLDPQALVRLFILLFLQQNPPGE